MDDKAEVGFVESHSERRRGHECLDLIGQQIRLELFAFGRFGGTGVGGDLMTLLTQQRRDVVSLSHGEGVDDSRPWQRINMCRKPSRTLRWAARLDHRKPQRLAIKAAAQYQRVLSTDAQLGGD